ncbi:MAG: transcriptional repressor [bacterium]
MKETNLNEKLKREFERMIAQAEIRLTPAQKKTVEFFLDTDEHLSLDTLAKECAGRHPGCATEDVERAMNLLVEYGFARKSVFDERGTLYEHRHLTEHHDHMVCVKCGKISEFFNHALEELQDSIALGTGFRALNHKLEIYGICPDCLGRRTALVPLAAVSSGERAALSEIIGGRELTARLADMGLTPGVEFEVVSNPGGGPVVVSVRDSRLALGRGMAEKVMVLLTR